MTMLQTPDYETARDLLLTRVEPVEAEEIPLEEAAGRILAADLAAEEDVPPFDRSPYDGYAFRSADTAEASPAASPLGQPQSRPLTVVCTSATTSFRKFWLGRAEPLSISMVI